jgi:hypothetical protein
MSIITDLRKHRIAGMAIFDWTGSFLVAYLVAVYFGLNLPRALVSVIPLSVIAHSLFGIESVFTLFVRNNIIGQILLLASIWFILR